MKALGLWQPYAGLVRMGIKTIETRFWSTSHRGEVLICSTQKIDPSFEAITRGLLASGHRFSPADVSSLGTMQCIATLVDCRVGSSADDEQACCSIEARHPRTGAVVQKYAWLLADIRPVVRKPIRCGRRWFDVPDDEVEVMT